MRRLAQVVGLVCLTSCAAISDIAVAPADSPGQRTYRAEGVTAAAARWVEVYVVQPKADPIAAASMVDSVRVAHKALLAARAASDPASQLVTVGQAIFGLVLVAEGQEGIAAPPDASGASGAVLTLIDDASSRLDRLGAARARLADLRGRLAKMTAAGRDPTTAEWAAQEGDLEVSYQAMLAAARLPND